MLVFPMTLSQGTGRAGRNGEPPLGLLLKYGRSNKYANKEML